MTVKAIFGTGLLILAVFLIGVRMWIVNLPEDSAPEQPAPPKLYLDEGEQRVIEIYANQPGWTLVAHGPVKLESYGLIDVGGLESDPRGNVNRPGDAKALVPRLPYGALVAKIGEKGEPFAIEWYTQVSMKEMVYVAINDADYSDNSGSYTLIATGRPR
jgi:hypothetical protein